MLTTIYKKNIYIIFDIAVTILSVVISALLQFNFELPKDYYDILFKFIPIAIIPTVFFSLILGVYHSELRFFGFSEMIKQFWVSLMVGALLFVLKLSNIMFISGSIIIIYCVIFFLFSSFIRGLSRFERYIISKSNNILYRENKKVLIIGAGKAGAMVIRQMLDGFDGNICPVGILDDDISKHGVSISNVKVLGSVDSICAHARELEAEEVLIALPSADEEQMKDIFNKVAEANLPTKIFQSAIHVEDYHNGVVREVTIEDLLFRKSVHTENQLNRKLIQGKVVLVTGGVGSIGSELCRQVLQNKCKHLIICDIHENGLFDINEEFKNLYEERYTLCLASVRDEKRMKVVFNQYKPQIVFHAAAHKHVPMMEMNPFEAVKNNVFGTLNVTKQAVKSKCEKFILISTDKAVNPTNVMGATKRLCELIVKSYNNKQPEMVAVRFGNVLGSNGSVVPLFKKQIEQGGPITITDKEMTRYFMTIKEAVSLVLSAGASANGSELFVLDMGSSVKIYDLAVNLIRLSGKIPFKDIDIEITGLRPGEKMYEELNLSDEVVDTTSHKKIFIMRDNGVDKDKISKQLDKLGVLVSEQKDEQKLRNILFAMIQEKHFIQGK